MEKNIDKRLKEIEIKKFGYSFSLGMAILIIISIWKNFGLPFKMVVSFMFVYHLFSSLFFYKLLYPMYIITSFVGKVLGNTLAIIIFTIVFYLLFTPIAIILRLLKKDVIKNFSISPQWITISDKQNDPKRIERLY